MYTREQALEIVERGLAASDADESEVIVAGGRLALTRFAANEIHQSVDEERPLIRVRGAWSRAGVTRQGVATTHANDDASLRDAFARARAAAMAAPADSQFRSMSAPGFYESNPTAVYGAFDQSLAEAEPIWRANEVARVLLRCRRYPGLLSSGYLRVTDGDVGEYGEPGPIAIGNTWGVRLHHRASHVEFSVTVDNGSSSAWAVSCANRRGAFDVEQIAAAAIDRVLRAPARTSIDAGNYRVILHPAAVAALLAFALPAFSQRAIDEARSYLSNRARLQVAAPMLSLVADPRDPELIPRPFDGEGVPSRRLVLIDEGIANEVAIGRDGVGGEAAANGFGRMQPTNADAAPWYARLNGGSGSVADLEARHPDTSLIARLWYNRAVNPRAVRVTGMTRDGFYTRRNGQIESALVDMRYNVSVFDVLRNVVDASEPVRIGNLMVPALVVDGFSLTSATVAP
jgi:predicted Zn-dependent protease